MDASRPEMGKRAAPSRAQPESRQRGLATALRRTLRQGGQVRTMALVTLALVGACVVVAPQSVSSASLLSMLPFAAVLAVAAAGQTVIVQQRGLDLSVAGNLSLGAVVVGLFSSRNELPLVVSLLVVAAAAVLVGLINGLLVAKLAMTPLIATFAVNALLVGVVRGYSGGAPATAPVALSQFVSARFLGIQMLVWIAVVVVAAMAATIRYTVVGRRFVAVGANYPAARASGIAVQRYLIGAYVVGSLCVALAGVLLAGYLRTVTPEVGTPYLLPVIAAVIIGGTPLTGGQGSIIASAVAALFLTQLGQLVLTLGAPSSIQMLIEAMAIAVAAVVRGLSGRGSQGVSDRRIRRQPPFRSPKSRSTHAVRSAEPA